MHVLRAFELKARSLAVTHISFVTGTNITPRTSTMDKPALPETEMPCAAAPRFLRHPKELQRARKHMLPRALQASNRARCGCASGDREAFPVLSAAASDAAWTPFARIGDHSFPPVPRQPPVFSHLHVQGAPADGVICMYVYAITSIDPIHRRFSGWRARRRTDARLVRANLPLRIGAFDLASASLSD